MDAIKRRRINLVLSVLLVLTLAFIWGNSLLSREESAEVSGNVMELFGDLFELLGLNTEDDHWLRKTTHFVEFGVLGCELALLFFLNRGRRISSAALAGSAALASALVDEGLQIISHRAPELRDVALDFTGAAFGMMLISLLLMFNQREKQNHG